MDIDGAAGKVVTLDDKLYASPDILRLPDALEWDCAHGGVPGSLRHAIGHGCLNHPRRDSADPDIERSKFSGPCHSVCGERRLGRDIIALAPITVS